MFLYLPVSNHSPAEDAEVRPAPWRRHRASGRARAARKMAGQRPRPRLASGPPLWAWSVLESWPGAEDRALGARVDFLRTCRPTSVLPIISNKQIRPTEGEAARRRRRRGSLDQRTTAATQLHNLPLCWGATYATGLGFSLGFRVEG